MVSLLASIAAQQGIWDNRFDQQLAKANDLLSLLPELADPVKRFELRRVAAEHFVQGGHAEAAISTLTQLLAEDDLRIPHPDIERVHADLAISYFRLGELQNCTWNHNSDSCLFPIQEGGFHTQKLGATEAIRVLTQLLSDPQVSAESTLSYRWLLNIGYMVLGKYPSGVPKKWLIPPDAFRSDLDIGRFRDVATSKGAAVFAHAGGAIMEDFDNDGHLDLMTSSMGLVDQLEYLHNDGNGSFSRRTERAGLLGIVGGLNIVQADYDNDGCIDVLVLRGAWLHDNGKFPPSLIRNNCDGTFSDRTVESGLLQFYPTQTATWADFDNDGMLDVFIGHELDRAHIEWPTDARNFSLYLNTGRGRFSERGAGSGIANNIGWIKGVTSGDFDNDGWTDLYVSVFHGANRLYRNLGTGKGGSVQFADVTSDAGVAEPFVSFPCWFWDFNNDGWQDIFVSGYSADLPGIVSEYLGQKEKARGERPRLYRNNQDGTFSDVSRDAGVDRLLLTMGSNFGDIDNDGWPDFYLGTGSPPLTMLVPNRMFRNDEGKGFQDVTTSGGFGHLQKGHGVAFGDFDGDGDQDVFEEMGGAFDGDKFWAALYENPGHGHHWIKLRLKGTRSNRFAVGARITLAGETKAGTIRHIHSTVSSGGSFGANSLRPHVGLGDIRVIRSMTIRWPGSGLVQELPGPFQADTTYEITEGLPASIVAHQD